MRTTRCTIERFTCKRSRVLFSKRPYRHRIAYLKNVFWEPKVKETARCRAAAWHGWQRRQQASSPGVVRSRGVEAMDSKEREEA